MFLISARGIFRGWGPGKFFFPIFPGVKPFFPVEIYILVDQKQISVVSKRERPKENNHLLIVIIFSFHFQISTFPFTISLLFFSIFTFFLGQRKISL